MIKGFHRGATKALLTAMLFALSVPAYADDVTDAVNEGLEYYKNGQYTDAAGSLDYAAQLIRQKKGGELTSLLPAPLTGWKAEEATSQSAGAAMFGGGVTAEKKYSKGASRVTVQFISDSPVMQGVMMMLSNPMYATSDGGKLERIAGQKAIIKYSAGDERGDIKIVVANRFLITIEGRKVTKEDLKGYAKAIDYKKLAMLP